MSIRITSPIEGHTDKSTFGPLTVQFKDGVAEVDELSQPLRAWLETKGYKVEAQAEGPFDPAKHTVDEVLAHLGLTEGSEPPTAEEYERVVAAEREGKARKGILDPIDKAPVVDPADPDPVVTVPDGGEGGDTQ